MCVCDRRSLGVFRVNARAIPAGARGGGVLDGTTRTGRRAGGHAMTIFYYTLLRRVRVGENNTGPAQHTGAARDPYGDDGTGEGIKTWFGNSVFFPLHGGVWPINPSRRQRVRPERYSFVF